MEKAYLDLPEEIREVFIDELRFRLRLVVLVAQAREKDCVVGSSYSMCKGGEVSGAWGYGALGELHVSVVKG